MKWYVSILLILILLTFVSPKIVAHPGRTDANGGHTCRTNCERWGLAYGEYHYHGITRTSTPLKKEDDSYIGLIILGFIGAFVLYHVINFFRNTTSRRNELTITRIGERRNRSIELTPIIKELPPPDEPISTSGVLIRRIYRKVPFFVATFRTGDGEVFTIVGRYEERLSVNKKYDIEGVITHHPRYGRQIKVKKMTKK